MKTVWKKDSLELNIIDDGAGIFSGIQKALGFQDIRESVLQLSKGKFTTTSNGHLGQGIFWSPVCSTFSGIFSDGLFYCKDNLRDDWFLEKRKISKSKGTRVSMAIGLNSKRTLTAVIRQYGGKDPDVSGINTTEILVQLSQMQEEPYISRTQAKRILKGLEGFQRVILDFKNIPTVGQAFVDEVFQVFLSKHPKMDIESVHANPDVQFMIERSLPS